VFTLQYTMFARASSISLEPFSFIVSQQNIKPARHCISRALDSPLLGACYILYLGVLCLNRLSPHTYATHTQSWCYCLSELKSNHKFGVWRFARRSERTYAGAMQILQRSTSATFKLICHDRWLTACVAVSALLPLDTLFTSPRSPAWKRYQQYWSLQIPLA
jgi:hypothetical protein